jgi:hypothetical protein
MLWVVAATAMHPHSESLQSAIRAPAPARLSLVVLGGLGRRRKLLEGRLLGRLPAQRQPSEFTVHDSIAAHESSAYQNVAVPMAAAESTLVAAPRRAFFLRMPGTTPTSKPPTAALTASSF